MEVLLDDVFLSMIAIAIAVFLLRNPRRCLRAVIGFAVAFTAIGLVTAAQAVEPSTARCVISFPTPDMRLIGGFVGAALAVLAFDLARGLNALRRARHART